MSKLTFDDLLTGKVKLKFGDLEQINVIREHNKKLEDKENMCPECDGDGYITVECSECNGTGHT